MVVFFGHSSVCLSQYGAAVLKHWKIPVAGYDSVKNFSETKVIVPIFLIFNFIIEFHRLLASWILRKKSVSYKRQNAYSIRLDARQSSHQALVYKTSSAVETRQSSHRTRSCTKWIATATTTLVMPTLARQPKKYNLECQSTRATFDAENGIYPA